MDYEVSAIDLKARLNSGESPTILDVREPWEFATARIEGSKHISMGEVPARAPQELHSEEHIIVVCHHGVRSLKVTHWLRQQGFKKAQSLRGGIDEWSRSVDPKVPLY